MLETGQVLDRYRIDSKLGSGGSAIVYKAVHTRLGSVHAVKVMTVPTKEQQDRLLQEGRVQAQLTHPNLVTVTDVLEVGGSPALVMEYVSGPSLNEWLEDNEPSLDEALLLFGGIVRGVGAAHAANLVHRDLKPSNVLLAETADGLLPKVTDFGLVKATVRSGNGPISHSGLVGTPQYMAPEQINEEQVDQRADMFALGCLLYEMVCGQRAFDTNDRVQAYNRILAGEFTPPEQVNARLPPIVASAIRRLLRIDPTTRPANCDVLLSMLFGSSTGKQTFDSGDSLSSGSYRAPTPSNTATPIRTRRSAYPTPFEPPTRRPSRWLLVASISAVLFVGVGSLGFVVGGLAQTPEPVAIQVPASLPALPAPRVTAEPAEPAVSSPIEEIVAEVKVPPAVEPEAKPRSAPAATVSVTGDATKVEFVGAAGTFPAGKVPPGSYEIRATFAGQVASAGSVKVRKGQSVNLACSSFMMLCKPQ